MTVTPDAPPGGALLPWVSGLREHGDRPAIITGDRRLTYTELARAVEELTGRLRGPRRLAMVEATATVESVVGYLAALAAGHVVLLTSDGPRDRLRTAYAPDILLGPDGSAEIVRAGPRYDLHPDLQLLLSTSGSTGSAKLVRLSAGNLAANAEQISEYLQIRADDCAALTLPLTYCYGLSVVHTHLARGASLLLTDLSVVDECFWHLFREAGATTFPGVPHTFEMLEHSGFAARELPSLRYVTQAGGRMDPDRVRRWAELGQARGWDLFVMYGQSEATARMTYLPPHLAVDHPDTVGVAVPGTSITLDDGEIVFQGPNVMMGYAHDPHDLALGRTLEVLHTGDLGRFTPQGLLQVIGRRARFTKVLGHRVDLDTLEQRLRGEGHDVRCAGRDDQVVVSVRQARAAPAREAVRRAVVAACGAPRDAVRVAPVDEHPTLASGKTDYVAVLALDEPCQPHVDTRNTSVAGLYAGLLHHRAVTDDSTFATLGGDSLSYVEVSIRLEELLGHLPPGWHVMAVGQLERLRHDVPADQETGSWPSWPRRPRPRIPLRDMESGVWLRALAIVLIVGTHADAFTLQGTANALLVIAGYQFVRFQLSEPDRSQRVRRILRATRRVVAPTVVVVAGAHLLTGDYEVRNVVLANWLFGEPQLGPPWRFWFIEALVVALLVTATLTAVPAFHRLDQRFPLGVPVALTGAAFVLFRLPILPLPIPHMQGSAHVVLYLFLLGWSLARVTTLRQRLVMTVLVVASIGTFSFNQQRDGLTIAFVLMLLWLPVTRVPAVLVPVIRPLAAASLYIYVIHWQALELLWGNPALAFTGSLAVGLAYWWLWTRGGALVDQWLPGDGHRSRPHRHGAARDSPQGPRTGITRGAPSS